MENNQLYGNLFNSIPIQSEEHLEILLNTMDEKNAIFILVQAVNYAHQNGLYTLGESEVLSKSIRYLSSKKD
jgi:hypothetical protein